MIEAAVRAGSWHYLAGSASRPHVRRVTAPEHRRNVVSGGRRARAHDVAYDPEAAGFLAALCVLGVYRLEFGVEIRLFGRGEGLMETGFVSLGEKFSEAIGGSRADPDLHRALPETTCGPESAVPAEEDVVRGYGDRLKHADLV